MVRFDARLTSDYINTHIIIMYHHYLMVRFDAGFTVEPRKGRAVLWPATLDADPFKKDERTHHEARHPAT